MVLKRSQSGDTMPGVIDPRKGDWTGSPASLSQIRF
jgi:hypothetical protein